MIGALLSLAAVVAVVAVVVLAASSWSLDHVTAVLVGWAAAMVFATWASNRGRR